MRARVSLVVASLLVPFAVACGGHLARSGDDHDAGTGGAGPAVDAGATLDAPAPADAAPDVHIVQSAVSCQSPAGVQAGSPWPVAWRCPSHGAYTAALGPTKNPTVAWQVSTTGQWQSTVIAADGTIYAFDTSRGVVALKDAGTVAWITPIAGPVAPRLAIGVDGTIYAWNGTLTALRPDGSVAWATAVTDSPVPPDLLEAFDWQLGFAVGVDGTLYVTDAVPDGPQDVIYPSANGHLFALDAAGHVMWSVGLGPDVFATSNPAVGSGGALYFTVQGPADTGPGASGPISSVVAYTPQGQRAWSAPAYSPTPCTIGPDGTLYLAAYELQAFTADGQPLTHVQHDMPPEATLLSPTTGTEYAVGGNELSVFQGNTYAWGMNGDVVPLQQAFVDGHGTLVTYMPQDFNSPAVGGLVGLDAKGNLVWSAAAGSPLSMGADGTVYACGDSTCQQLLALAP